ncbi:bacillithiol biosynthesis cysteine-adding enzyme BshC [Paenibacillus thalictri]|uniref:Putative cysteine ligase BshC n=1 Tax=Paenibacillus thalictri TaxID=2527873 RepID=A0A4Q9DQS6_9BACL|nr:bacillithiol biosynthesis cysteine-adding enzyme BshC [Paenibacillus thalictri]TBL78142.1 bacillithiol biosynthesis cysteine-adding enzyme BshC [Paenibacillus thalictri]
MNIHRLEWTSTQPLAEAYLRDFGKVAPLFDYNVWQQEEWVRRAEWVDDERRFSVDREGLCRVLTRFNRSIGADEAALASIDKLSRPDTLAIVGGQQAGLFTGQLLVIYKAITLLQTAKQAEAQLGRTVVPVFWIAGEDHDFDEVNHIFQLTSDLRVEKIKLERTGDKRGSVSRLQIAAEQWESVLDQLDAGLMQTEFKASLMEQLREFAASSATLVDFFGKMMAWLFRETGLVFINSDDPDLRALESSMFERLIEEHRPLQAAVENRARKVQELGFTPQVEIQQGNANLFVCSEGERVLLYAQDDGFSTRRHDRFLTKEQLLDYARQAPGKLSNNVITRPLMQEYLFPVLGTVLGPGEIAYWAQLGEAFHQLGMRMPLIVPRVEVTLMEGTVTKHMGKYGLTVEDVIHRFEEKRESWLQAQDTLHLDEQFEQVRRQFKASYEPLVGLIAGINPGLKKLGETNLGKIVEQIDFLEQKASDAYRAQFDAALRQLTRIQLSVLPQGRPQERIYNVVSYLNRYGERWLRELMESPLEPDGFHRISEL